MRIFFDVLGLILIAVTLPLVVELLMVTTACYLPKRKREDGTPLPKSPSLIILVPAHNEERLVGRSVKSLRASAMENAKVVVIAHNCSDHTAEEARRAGAEALVYNDSDAKGKGYALRFGFSYAIESGYDAAMVVDADSVVTFNTVPELREALAQGADVVQCRYEMKSNGNKAKEVLSALAFRGFTFIRPLGRERLGLSAGILGNGFAVTTQTLKEVPYDAFSIVEDLEFHLHLMRAGKCVRFIEDAVVTSHLPTSSDAENSQRSRWEGGRLRVAKMSLVPLFKEVLRGHYSMIEPVLDLAGLPLAFAAVALLAALALPVHAVRLYAVTALIIMTVHVVTAAWAGPNFFRTLRTLSMVPLYILWKLCLIPRLFRASHAQAAWIRTAR
jgi:cellulose synthase/poly-beta-1,6-N-acetylglucosamine synthase-like glycosyltransferase